MTRKRGLLGCCVVLGLLVAGCQGEQDLTLAYGWFPFPAVIFHIGNDQNGGDGQGGGGGGTGNHLCDGHPCTLADFPSIAGTNIRIWEENPDEDSLSIQKWDGHMFVKIPSFVDLLAADGVILDSIKFETTGGTFTASGSECLIIVPKLPEDVCSTALVSGHLADGTAVTFEYPKNCR